MSPSTKRTLELWGWGLFIVSAGFFMTSSFRSGDVMGFLGGLCFLVASILFLIPMLRRNGGG